ncbi:winged helix-turn-helix domain-containing protein [Haladaptatus sp. CMAA 1911]|uniref:winged helix-turn-helix domain-containing protein n=1 Tax=unclassified Haladaptatus TaxID=2622732 RepID=UPI003754C8B7
MTDDDPNTLPPSEAFALFADETRVAIVEALAERTTDEGNDGLSFTELRRAVGVRDAGQFNYHLSKLRDRFVVKRDEKYYPRYAVLRLVGAIREGSFTERTELRSETLEYDCPGCDRSLMGTYEDGFVKMECDEHDMLFQTSVPPQAATGRSVSEIVSFANEETQHHIQKAIDGTCFICSGPMCIEKPHRNSSDQLVTELGCESCWLQMHLPVTASVIRHPAVVSYFYERGIDVRTVPVLSFDFVWDDLTEVVSEEPYRIRVDVGEVADAPTLTLDRELNVVNVE